MNLRKKLLYGGAALTLVPMLVLGSLLMYRTVEIITNFAREDTMQATEKLCAMVQELIAREVLQAKAISSMSAVEAAVDKVAKDGRESAKEEIDALNREFVRILKQLGDQYISLVVTDRNGISFAGTKVDGDVQPYRKLDFSDRDYFKAARQGGKPGVGSLVKGKTVGKPTMVYYVPLKSAKGEFEGILFVASYCDALQKMVSESKVGKTGFSFLADDNGAIIAHPDPKLVLEANLNALPGLEKVGRMMMDQKKGMEYYTYQGVEKLVSFAPVGVRSWSIGSAQSKEEIAAPARELLYRALAIGGGLLALSLILVFFFGRSISRPIAGVVEGLSLSASHVSSAAAQLSSTSQELAEGSSEQAASLEETSSSLEEMSSMTRQNAETAQNVHRMVSEAAGMIGKANDSMTRLTDSMHEISQASEETQKIIRTIDEIAFQTNLLALNAAVEAARAGEAGAGFAVVADEVRNLAMRAADAAKNTASLIEGTVKKVKDGSGVVESTSKEFREVAANASKVGELVGEIAAASQEQAQGIEQVNRAVSEMDKVVQRNASSAEESAGASVEMQAQSEQMKGFVESLVAMVGGSGEGAAKRPGIRKGLDRAASSPSKKASSESGRPAPKTTRIALGAPGSGPRETNPRQVIPFDDEGDF